MICDDLEGQLTQILVTTERALGEERVKTCLSLLTAARRGLDDTEILDILAHDELFRSEETYCKYSKQTDYECPVGSHWKSLFPCPRKFRFLNIKTCSCIRGRLLLRLSQSAFDNNLKYDYCFRLIGYLIMYYLLKNRIFSSLFTIFIFDRLNQYNHSLMTKIRPYALCNVRCNFV